MTLNGAAEWSRIRTTFSTSAGYLGPDHAVDQRAFARPAVQPTALAKGPVMVVIRGRGDHDQTGSQTPDPLQGVVPPGVAVAVDVGQGGRAAGPGQDDHLPVVGPGQPEQGRTPLGGVRITKQDHPPFRVPVAEPAGPGPELPVADDTALTIDLAVVNLTRSSLG